jgi:hypothetical protein
MRIKTLRGRLAPVLVALIALTVSVTVTGAAADGHHKKPWKVHSKDDAAKAVLTPALQQTLESGTNKKIGVVATLKDADINKVRQLLDSTFVAKRAGVALLVGQIPAQHLAKLATSKGVVSVAAIAFKQTGKPLGTDPVGEVGKQPDQKTRNEALRAFQKNSVPFDKAPPLKTSNFDQLKSLNVLDAKTHNFTGAWQAGYTGTGVTASVLDGGTDWGHPDLIGTWQTWSAQDVADANANGLWVDPNWVGWPKAFDPYDTLVFLQAPDFVDAGLSWYTNTTTGACTLVRSRDGHDDNRGHDDRKNNNKTCNVAFATKTGPSRNLNVAAGTAPHTYSFPASWSKSGTVKLSSHPDDYLLQLYGERPAVLLTDPNTAGVYDTAYVDLNDDFDFADEKPVTKSSPVSYRDLNGDGYTDLSGGLLYFIADGNTTIPGGVTEFGVVDKPAAGSMLAWTGDFDPGIEGHGTLTASNVVGQGVVNGKAVSFNDLKSKRNRDGTIPGMVLGGAPNAKLAPMGDIYFAFDFSKQFGYLLTNEYGVNVTSNSYGSSDIDNDGMDAGSQEADIIHNFIGGRTVTPLFSTGNGGPGFGTVTAPSPVLGIQVGASTQFGATGWDSVANYSQVTDNDVIEWSNRGPGANGRPGTDLVADGSYSDGDATLNTVIDGRNAWVTWGGTSRSTPVAVGATALVYQAYKAAHGSFPLSTTVKSILKSSAQDLGYDSYVQGAGSLDAGKAVSAAVGSQGFVTPDEWRPNTDPAAAGQPAFPQTINPGQSATRSFAINGPGSWTVSDRQLGKIATDSFAWTSSSVSQESTPNFNAPDYLMDITSKIKAHPDADLIVIRANYPHSEFDGNNDSQTDQSWRLLAYNWTDVNHNGRLWRDKNGNGVVNHTDKSTSSNIDGFNDLNFDRSEMDQGEYARFFYHRPGSNALTGFVNHPNQRMADGIYLGLQHSKAGPADQTHFSVEIDYYKNSDWSWLSTSPVSGGTFSATLAVPADAPYGAYEGAIVASNGSSSSVIPVTASVAAVATQDSDGNITAPLTFGGNATATSASNANQLYNNGTFFGANDWTWREESGDWRFFNFQVPNPVPDGTLFLTDTTWDDAGPTDLDTLLFGPSANSYQLFGGSSPVFAPYILDTIGKSQNAYVGSGTWLFNTATNGPEDVVAAPASDGLHSVVQHGVNFNGDKFDVGFKSTVGTASVSPTELTGDTTDGAGSFDVTFKSSVPLDGLAAAAYGLSQPKVTTEHVAQDDPNDPSTASTKVGFTVNHASRATIKVDVGSSDDVDLYVYYDANNDHAFTPDERVGASTGGTGADEEVDLVAPGDGDYQVWLHGFQVSGSAATAGLSLDIPQGNDITVTGPSGAIPANTPQTIHVTYSNAALVDGGTYEGELLLGPTIAPTAVTIPISITKQP